MNKTQQTRTPTPTPKPFSTKDFPLLTKTKSKSSELNLEVSYAEQIKKENTTPEKESVYTTPPGWTTLQQVKGRNQVIITRNPINELTEEPHAVLNALVSLDRKRKQYYMNTWGEENYNAEFPKYEPIYSSSDESEEEDNYSDIITEDFDIY